MSYEWIECRNVAELRNYYKVTGKSKSMNASNHLRKPETASFYFYIRAASDRTGTSSGDKLLNSKRWVIKDALLKEIYELY